MGIIEMLETFELGQNSALDYLWALGIFVILMLILKIIQSVILARLQRFAQATKTKIDDVLIEIFRGIRPPFYLLISLYFAFQALTIPSLVQTLINIAFIIAIVYEVVSGVTRIIDFFVDSYVKKVEKTGEKKLQIRETRTMMKALQLFIKLSLWFIGTIMVLSNLGVDVSSLVASLGITGIAVALAVQNILGDLFSAFTIYVDKPFQIGDFIVIGEDSGTVQKIGLKSTRIKTLQGEELIVSNKELTTARVQNFKRLKKRRVQLDLGVLYETDAKQLKAIPKYVKEEIGTVKGVKFDRCHLEGLRDFSINFELVYFVDSSEYDDYMSTKQNILLAITKRFVKEGIEFAYPTQTLYVHKQQKSV